MGFGYKGSLGVFGIEEFLLLGIGAFFLFRATS